MDKAIRAIAIILVAAPLLWVSRDLLWIGLVLTDELWNNGIPPNLFPYSIGAYVYVLFLVFIFVGSRKLPKIEAVERGNLSIRMGMRRFTRLTNGFSKKFDNHRAALGLHFALYNYVTVHGTLRTTPAVAAGVAQKPWTVAELIERTRDYSPPPVQKNFLDFLGDDE